LSFQNKVLYIWHSEVVIADLGIHSLYFRT
jgi:hypothetical protein